MKNCLDILNIICDWIERCTCYNIFTIVKPANGILYKTNYFHTFTQYNTRQLNSRSFRSSLTIEDTKRIGASRSHTRLVPFSSVNNLEIPGELWTIKPLALELCALLFSTCRILLTFSTCSLSLLDHRINQESDIDMITQNTDFCETTFPYVTL